MRSFAICDGNGVMAVGKGFGLDAMVAKALEMWWGWGLGYVNVKVEGHLGIKEVYWDQIISPKMKVECTKIVLVCI